MNRSDLAFERKVQIINATIECITRYGYSNFSMQDVARVADVSKGIIHYYFLNKEDLMMGVLNYVGTDIENLLQGDELITNPIERLSNVIWICSGIVLTKREYYRINMDFWTQIDQKEKVRQEIAVHYTKFRTAIIGVIEQGIAKKLFKQGDSHLYASMIIAMVDGISLQWLFEEGVFNYDKMVKNCEEAIMKFLLVDK